MLEEIESERKWGKTFAESEDVIDKLADEAIEAHRMGKTKTMFRLFLNDRKMNLLLS